jgi:hypothetical protein
MELLVFVSDVGFPIAAACVGMYFVYLTQKFLLESVLEKVKGLIVIIKQLDSRVTSMSQDILKIDALLSEALELHIEKLIKKAD